MGLTVKRIARLTKPGRYRDERGLYLQVLSPTNRSWLFRYERRGRERWMGLGALHAFTLDEARERARKARQQLADGIDPIEARKVERNEAEAARAVAIANTITFQSASEDYYAQHHQKWSNRKHAKQFLSTLSTYAYPIIGSLPVAEIETGHVLRVLEPIWHEKTETASRVRSRIERVLTWCSVRGYRTGENPARWTGHLREALPARNDIAPPRNQPAMPFDEVPDFLKRLRQRPAVAARGLEFLILTATRTNEVTGAKWDEIDLKEKVWTIPGARMKARRPHRIPLCDRAVAILRDLPREGDYVFVGGRKGKPMSNMAMAMLLRRMDIPPEYAVVHGFRSSFRDWAAERTNYPNHVAEAALAHVVGDKVEAAYRRGDLFDKRRRLMEEWAVSCMARKADIAA